ncbi:MAG: TonB family protein [Rhizomicrobium sp.]|nr:TonB family protein [Rhizomicrobium sp.]
MQRALIPIFLVFFIFAGSAAAAPPDSLAVNRGAAAITTPTAIGIGHGCLEFYPPLAVRLHSEGKTALSFTIGIDGTVRDPMVTLSSGDPLLDQAAIDCVKRWTYQPATENGTAVAVPWKVRVDWYLHNNPEGPVEAETPPPGAKWIRPLPAPAASHGCSGSFSSLPDPTPPSGPSALTFTIMPDGTTRDVKIAQSSGSEAHDNKAVECIKSWRYIPASHDGVPVSVHWKASVDWHTTQQAATTPGAPIPPRPPITTPSSVGAPHVCLQDYPAEAIAAHAEGTTVIGFTITVAGTTANVHVTRSSGTQLLDDAAVSCATHWLYRPAVEGGKPVAVPWKAEVRWALHGPDMPPAVTAPKPIGVHSCPNPRGVTIPAGAVTILSVAITAEGKVSETTLRGSSGSAELDSVANKCALGWRYEPAIVDGKAAPVRMLEKFTW